MHSPKLAYSVEEFAEISGKGRTAVYAAIKAGHLKARKDGRRTLILHHDGMAYLEGLPVREAA